MRNNEVSGEAQPTDGTGDAAAETSGDDTLIRLEPGHARAWDLADDFR